MVLRGGKQQAQGGENAGGGGHQDGCDIEGAGQGHGMYGAVAAKGHQCELARIAAPLGRDRAQGPGHGRVRDPVNAVRRLIHRYPQRTGDLRLDSRRRGLGVEGQFAAHQIIRIDEAQHHVGVRHRGHGAALAVANRSRHRACAFRPDGQGAAWINPHQTAATGPNLGDIDGRHAHVMAAALQQSGGVIDAGAHVNFTDPVKGAAFDNRRLGGGAAHVECQHVLESQLGRDLRAADDTGGGTGFDNVYRPLTGGLDPHGAAAGLHHQQGRGDVKAAQRGGQRGQVAGYDGQDIGIDDGGGGSLILLDLGQDLRRQANRHIRCPFGDQFTDAPFVGAVGIGIDQRYRDRLDPVGQQFFDCRPCRDFVQWGQNAALVVNTLDNLGPVGAAGQGLGLLPGQIVKRGHAKAANFQDIAEAVRGDQSGLDAPAFQNGVGSDGGAVDNLGNCRGGDCAAPEHHRQALGDAAAVVVRRRGHFQRQGFAVGGQEHHVGKRAADIDADPVTHTAVPPSLRAYTRSSAPANQKPR